MPRALRWSRPFRAAAWRIGLLRDPTRAAARSVERYLDGEGAAQFRESGVPGLAVVVRFAGGREIVRYLGDAGNGKPVGPDTLFQVLSLTKPVTAMVALALVDDGLLALNDPVWRRLRSWRLPTHRTGGFDPDAITLRRLLSHTAGLNVEMFGWTEPGVETSARSLLESEAVPSRTLSIVREPGTLVAYSGGGYGIVHVLVEEVTGTPFAKVARERLLAPLGVKAGGYEAALALSQDLATPHHEDRTPYPAAGVLSTGSSGFTATAGEVATLWAALAPGGNGAPAGRDVLSEASCRELLTAQGADAKGATCGLGMYVKPRRDDVKYMHMGYDRGWYLHAEGLLRRRVVSVLLSNSDAGRALVPALAHALRERLLAGVL